jgi:ubiquitin-protein ligase
MHQPPNIAAQTPIAPRAKLSPPVKITTIMARPIIISIATTRDSAKILKRDVKPSVTVEKIITKITTRHSRPN